MALCAPTSGSPGGRWGGGVGRGRWHRRCRGLARRLPVIRQQVRQSFGRCGRQPRQHVVQVRPGLDAETVAAAVRALQKKRRAPKKRAATLRPPPERSFFEPQPRPDRYEFPTISQHWQDCWSRARGTPDSPRWGRGRTFRPLSVFAGDPAIPHRKSLRGRPNDLLQNASPTGFRTEVLSQAPVLEPLPSDTRQSCRATGVPV